MNRRGKFWSLAWRIAVGGLLLLWIFHNIFSLEGREAVERGGQAWSNLSRAEQWHAAVDARSRRTQPPVGGHLPGHLIGSFALVGVALLLGVLRWRLVLRVVNIDLSFTRAARITLVAQFFNAFLLGSAGGDLLKAYYAARESHHRKTEAVTTVVVDRLIGLGTMLIFASVMMLPNLTLIRDHHRLTAVSGFVLLMMAGCVGVLAVAFWGGLTRIWPSARHSLRRLPKGAHLERSLDACRQFGRDPGFLVQSLFLSMLINFTVVVQGAVLCDGLGVPVPFEVLLLLIPTIICISALPITPSGLGVRENLLSGCSPSRPWASNRPRRSPRTKWTVADHHQRTQVARHRHRLHKSSTGRDLQGGRPRAGPARRRACWRKSHPRDDPQPVDRVDGRARVEARVSHA
ncbi:MAG: flippase-like domain-containing protein [Rhodobacteraceae bacterium]|nr:flippase-like domain-containing protein [Paracoccaceae bacterium]